MFKDKLQVEKIEKVKQIIRAHNYSNYERAHQDCQELGINVNRPALDRFADRLFITDKQQKQKKLNPVSSSIQLAETTSEEPSAIQVNAKKHNGESASHISQTASSFQMNYADIQKRQNEITFELGQLKIRENELLQELLTLKAQNSH